MADEMPPPADTQALVPGLSNPRLLSLERFPIGLRGESATQSAWRLTVACDEGEGTITLVEISPRERFYRGEGVFLGWPQERMKAAYDALLPRGGEPEPVGPQLG